MDQPKIYDDWPPAPLWAEKVNRNYFDNNNEVEVDRHYEGPVQVGGVTATIFEFHAREEGEENAGKITDAGGPGIALDVDEFTPENAEDAAGALLAASSIYRRSLTVG